MRDVKTPPCSGLREEGWRPKGRGAGDSSEPVRRVFTVPFLKPGHHKLLLHKFCNTPCSPHKKQLIFFSFRVSVALCSHWKLNVSAGRSAWAEMILKAGEHQIILASEALEERERRGRRGGQETFHGRCEGAGGPAPEGASRGPSQPPLRPEGRPLHCP